MVRIYFKYGRKLLTQLCHCARASLELFFRTVLGLADGILGMIMVIHTLGDYVRVHPHLHAIVADSPVPCLVLEQKQGRKNQGRARSGDEPASPEGHSEVSEHQPRRIPSKTWRELIKRIWEVDPLGCPRCGYEMKLLSLIHEPDVMARILRHLGLWKQYPEPREGKIKAPEDGPVVMANFDAGWPGYEEPVFVYH